MSEMLVPAHFPHRFLMSGRVAAAHSEQDADLIRRRQSPYSKGRSMTQSSRHNAITRTNSSNLEERSQQMSSLLNFDETPATQHATSDVVRRVRLEDKAIINGRADVNQLAPLKYK